MDTQLIAFKEIDNFIVPDELRRNLNITDINYQHAVKTNHGWFGGYALCKSSNGFVLFHAVQTQYLKTKWIQWMYECIILILFAQNTVMAKSEGRNSVSFGL